MKGFLVKKLESVISEADILWIQQESGHFDNTLEYNKMNISVNMMDIYVDN